MTATVLDETNSIVIEPTEYGFPPLMIVATGERVCAEEFMIMRDTILDAQSRNHPLMFTGGDFKVFQLIDGRWVRLD